MLCRHQLVQEAAPPPHILVTLTPRTLPCLWRDTHPPPVQSRHQTTGRGGNGTSQCTKAGAFKLLNLSTCHHFRDKCCIWKRLLCVNVWHYQQGEALVEAFYKYCKILHWPLYTSIILRNWLRLSVGLSASYTQSDNRQKIGLKLQVSRSRYYVICADIRGEVVEWSSV